jgi:hypothetical protein
MDKHARCRNCKWWNTTGFPRGICEAVDATSIETDTPQDGRGIIIVSGNDDVVFATAPDFGCVSFEQAATPRD